MGEIKRAIVNKSLCDGCANKPICSVYANAEIFLPFEGVTFSIFQCDYRTQK